MKRIWVIFFFVGIHINAFTQISPGTYSFTFSYEYDSVPRIKERTLIIKPKGQFQSSFSNKIYPDITVIKGNWVFRNNTLFLYTKKEEAKNLLIDPIVPEKPSSWQYWGTFVVHTPDVYYFGSGYCIIKGNSIKCVFNQKALSSRSKEAMQDSIIR